MTVLIRYNGRTTTGRIESAKLVDREMHVEVSSADFKVAKWLHHSHVKVITAHSQQIVRAA